MTRRRRYRSEGNMAFLAFLGGLLALVILAWVLQHNAGLNL
jgi:hypothetical protein